MIVDSLLLTILMGILSTGEIPMTPILQDLDLDSISITVTVEIAETLIVESETAESTWNPELFSNRDSHAISQQYLLTAIDRAAAFATAWGADGLFSEDVGYLSVSELVAPANWKFRTTITRSLITPREERIRWSLVHGIF